jgi:hypothetical protein
MKSMRGRSTAGSCAVLGLSVILCLPCGYGAVDTAGVCGQWGVWSCWYWPFNETLPPNLYGTNEVLARYDAFTGAASRAWEYDHHGPSFNQPDWGGHCHACAGVSVWECMPLSNRVCAGVTFRVRDLAALMTEAYYNDTQATEISEYRPTPGLLWRYLRQEILGQNSMHGHAMALIGNLTPQRGEIWNYPIYQYTVNYTQALSGGTYSGIVTLVYADDSKPAYADSLGLSSGSVSYQFSGVSFDANQVPLDSGSWAGNDPSLYPTSIWRPYYAASWTNYVANPELDGTFLTQILDVFGLGDALNASALKWTTGGDVIWKAESATAHDGSGAAESGKIGNSQVSWFQTTVTGPGTIAFWWKVSSEAGYDFLEFFMDGQEQPGCISGEVDWQLMSFAVSRQGPHTLQWVYAKDDWASAGADRAWIDQVTWAPAFDPGPPTLAASRNADQVVISWGTNWPHHQLEWCTSAVPPQAWSPVATTPSIVGGYYSVTNPLATSRTFYRLRLP